MKNFQSTELLILRELSRSGGKLHAFSVFRRTRIFPAKLALALTRLNEAGIAELDGLEVRLTDYGNAWVLKNRERLRGPKSDLETKIRAEFLRPARSPWEPYVPLTSRLDRSFLPGGQKKR